MKHKWKGLVVAVLIVVAVFNGSVSVPVASALGADSRNASLTVVAYRSAGIHPTDITLNLLGANVAAPIDAFRVVFQSADALKDRRFGKVSLVRGWTHVYSISGADFQEIGQEYAAGQNPVYLIRTLPEKLLLPDGRPAFGTWTGGILGVVSQQMDDVNKAARTWIGVE